MVSARTEWRSRSLRACSHLMRPNAKTIHERMWFSPEWWKQKFTFRIRFSQFSFSPPLSFCVKEPYWQQIVGYNTCIHHRAGPDMPRQGNRVGRRRWVLCVGSRSWCRLPRNLVDTARTCRTRRLKANDQSCSQIQTIQQEWQYWQHCFSSINKNQLVQQKI